VEIFLENKLLTFAIIMRTPMPRPTPFLIPVLSLCSITCVSERPARADEPPCPSQEQIATTASKGPLRESALPTGGNFEIETDTAVGNMLDWTVLLKGNVEIKQGVRELRGEEIQYNRTTNSVKSERRLEYTDPLVHLIGNDGASYSPDAGGDFKGAEFSLRQRSARGTAKSMQWTPQGVLRMQRVTFTTCPTSDESWKIKAKSVTLDTQSKIGQARGATIDFAGVPIMYLPSLSFPLSNERKSGFLFPVFGQTSQSGALVSAPIYWNMAPNVDFTFEPTYYSRRNEDLGGNFRYLTESSHGDLTWNYLPHDTLYQSQFDDGDKRSLVRFTDITEMPGGLRLSLLGANVSDSHYFENFAQGPEGAATAFLDRTAMLSYRDEHWRIDALGQEYQTVDETLSLYNRPYARVPRVGVDGDFGWGVLSYGFDSEAVRFTRGIEQLVAYPSTAVVNPTPTCAQITDIGCEVTGWRYTLVPHLALNLDGPGYFVHPSIAYHATEYQLANVMPQNPSQPIDNRPLLRLPIASFDTGLVFERQMGSSDKHTLTLEPRLMYLYIPFRDQSGLPIFDTAVPDLNPIQLFRTNRYVGGDRVGDAKELAAGFTTRLLDTASGQQFLSATIGEAYYFTPPRVTIPGEAPLDHHSDLIAQLHLTAFEHWSADFGLQLDPTTTVAVREYVNLQYKPSPTHVVNLSWRYEQFAVDQVEFSTAWPVTHRWNAFLREIYSLRRETYFVPTPAEPLETFVGLEYRSCCWGMRVGGRQFVSSFNSTKSTGAFLELELMGFASVGSASDTVLMENIRGYVPPNARVPQNFVPPPFP
jgi:LPS-assembly protein